MGKWSKMLDSSARKDQGAGGISIIKNPRELGE